MRVLILNTSASSGGAAIAARRLCEALNRHGVLAGVVVRRRWSVAFLWERLLIWWANRFRREGLWAVDIACAGRRVTQLPAFREADVVHLHWVNQGMLSLAELGRILRSGKPVVWTMHDMWPCTAVCHHARECDRFQTHCHDCPQLAVPGAHDLSWQVFRKKLGTYVLGRITFVGCSRWITGRARTSSLLAGMEVLSIPNTYPADLFQPADPRAARRCLHLPVQGRLLLFACQKVTSPRKGLSLLLEALQRPRLRPWQGRLSLVVVGQMSEEVAAHVPFPVHALGYVSGDAAMATLYQAVDLFVTPSLEENLPNTLMEALACGTPCVGFDIGGVPEMIDHKVCGYVARYADPDDLAEGIAYSLDNARHAELAAAAAEKALKAWNEEVVARRYTELYQRLLTQ